MKETMKASKTRGVLTFFFFFFQRNISQRIEKAHLSVDVVSKEDVCSSKYIKESNNFQLLIIIFLKPKVVSVKISQSGSSSVNASH